jgi:hypothetical protein
MLTHSPSATTPSSTTSSSRSVPYSTRFSSPYRLPHVVPLWPIVTRTAPPRPPRMSTGEALRCNALDTYPAILRSGVSSDPSPSRPRATPGSSLQRKTSLQAFAFVLNPAYFVSSLTRMTPLMPFEAAVRVLNPEVAVKVRSAAVHAALATLSVSSPFSSVPSRTPHRRPSLRSGPEDTSFASRPEEQDPSARVHLGSRRC